MLASLAATRQASATSTRQRHCPDVGQQLARASSSRSAAAARARRRGGRRRRRQGGGSHRVARRRRVIDGRIGRSTASRWSNMPEISNEDARAVVSGIAPLQLPDDRQLVMRVDADAGRRQRQRRHLRWLDHGPGRPRRRRPSGQDRQGPDRHRRGQPVRLQAAGLDGRPAQLLRPRSSASAGPRSRSTSRSTPSATRPTCTSSR